MIFLQSAANSSEHTYRKYKKDIEDFFLYVRNKEIENLTLEDIKVVNAEVLDYQNYLSKRYKNSTTNGKFNAIKSLYKFFKQNELDVNPYAVSVKDLPDDSQRTGGLTKEEAFLLADLALHYETHNRYMKYALILTAFATSIRIGALVKLEYKHIRPCENDPDKYIINPDFLDKGKEIYKEIHADVYNAMLLAREKDPRKRKDDRIFTMDTKGANEMMKRLFKIAGFDPRRKITFHSIRKGATDYAYEVSGGDMAVVTAQGNWSSPATAYKHYMKKQVNIVGMAAFEKIDDDIFDQLSHEELLQLVKKQKNGLGLRLKREAQEIVNGRHNTKIKYN
jgi:integrase